MTMVEISKRPGYYRIKTFGNREAVKSIKNSVNKHNRWYSPILKEWYIAEWELSNITNDFKLRNVKYQIIGQDNGNDKVVREFSVIMEYTTFTQKHLIVDTDMIRSRLGFDLTEFVQTKHNFFNPKGGKYVEVYDGYLNGEIRIILPVEKVHNIALSARSPLKARNYYEVLGLPIGCDISAVKPAYKSRAIELHPDRGGSHEEFIRIKEAYEILSNPKKKKKYDFILSMRKNDNIPNEIDPSNVLKPFCKLTGKGFFYIGRIFFLEIRGWGEPVLSSGKKITNVVYNKLANTYEVKYA